MYYVVQESEILALCLTKERAEQIRLLLTWDGKGITL